MDIVVRGQIGNENSKTLVLHGFTEKIIAERKLYHEQTNGRYLKIIENNDVTETDGREIYGREKKRLAMLDLLIAASREHHLTDMDIREEVDTFTFEGHDTTAIAISYTLLLLAEHKEIQVLLDRDKRYILLGMLINFVQLFSR
ncbi:PREDICTED: cytochrome P450 4C1-like [Dinoponera quadriceps]|uniref:Cytochrome P450 4C1-like n=1 Tax=Dinoponera quadriceps TaxID=609295 RepID=A0A6P3Y9T0_DINQU|nr:PREDICTED: cytochrome P450 4C1-like [Dinoponera quadriceps]